LCLSRKMTVRYIHHIFSLSIRIERPRIPFNDRH